MDTKVFMAELKTRAVEMFSYLSQVQEGKIGDALISEAVEVALDQASGELSMQKFSDAMTALGGTAAVREKLKGDLRRMNEEWIANALRLAEAPMQHPANIARQRVELRKQREQNWFRLGYHQAILDYGLDGGKDRDEVEGIIKELEEEVGERSPDWTEGNRDLIKSYYLLEVQQ